MEWQLPCVYPCETPLEPRFGQRRSTPIAVMLKEVEMAPGELRKVVSLAGTPAGRARIERAPLSFDAQVKAVRVDVDVEMRGDDAPGRFQPKANREDLVSVHAPMLPFSDRFPYDSARNQPNVFVQPSFGESPDHVVPKALRSFRQKLKHLPVGSDRRRAHAGDKFIWHTILKQVAH